MAISETLAAGATSATTVPTAATSDALAEGGDFPQVVLEAQAPGQGWLGVTTMAAGALSVATPDTAINYRFRHMDANGRAVNVYFGP